MTIRLRRSPQTSRVLEQFLEAPLEWRYGYDLSRETGLKSGTLYPILIRLSRRGFLETSWKATEPGTPPRHLYRLTARGLEMAKAQRQINPARRQALGAVPAGGEP
jgi:DNA-binding PadR family transcriptional regulator